MLIVLKKFYGKAGLDSSITFTILTRIVQSAGGLLTLIMIARFLDKNEQGYFYTFLSILAIRMFFEMGLTTILTQYVAHEAAHLSWSNGSILIGEEYYLSRLASIIQLSVKWFLILAVLMFLALLFGGRFFFSKFNMQLNISWQLPWLILSVSTCFILMLDLLLAVLEGLGKINEIAKLRLVQQSINLLLLGLFLFANLKLLSHGLALFGSTIITGIILLLSGNLKVINSLWREQVKWKVNYKKEILPYQLRIALGNVSNYFVFQLFNPVLFATQGPIVAGQMGATQTFLNGIGVVSMSWMSTKIALFSNLVAKRKFKQLNLSFRKSTFISVVVCFTGIIAFIILILVLKEYYPALGKRFLGIEPIILLGLTQLTNVIGTAQGFFLRSFKKDPFFVSSIVIGILTGISTLICSKYFGITGITMGCFIINGVIGIIWGTMIYRNKKFEWTAK